MYVIFIRYIDSIKFDSTVFDTIILKTSKINQLQYKKETRVGNRNVEYVQ